MNPPKKSTFSVAVVIPAYRAEKTITKALESIYHQTLQPCGVWIIDDLSTDATVSVARRFISERGLANWHVICQTINTGPGGARHTGITSASADYIALLDADDEWYPAHLEKSSSWIRDHSLELFGAQFGKTDAMEPGKLCAIGRRSLLLRNSFRTSTVVFSKRAYLQAGGFEPAVRYSEDYLLWLRMCLVQHCKAAVSTAVHAKYAPEAATQITRLTKQLWRMEKAELSNYNTLLAEQHISLPEYLMAWSLSLAKYIRRMLVTVLQKQSGGDERVAT